MKSTTTITQKRSARSLLTACVLIAVSSTAMAQVPPPPAEPAVNQAAQAAGVNVPLRQVTLHSSGVGFFEHAGPVPEAGQLQLRFREDQINDILKSQQVFGADTATVSFDTAEPPPSTTALKSPPRPATSPNYK